MDVLLICICFQRFEISELNTAEGHRASWEASCLINKFCHSISKGLVCFLGQFGFYLVCLLLMEEGWKGSRVLRSVSGTKIPQTRQQSSTQQFFTVFCTEILPCLDKNKGYNFILKCSFVCCIHCKHGVEGMNMLGNVFKGFIRPLKKNHKGSLCPHVLALLFQGGNKEWQLQV